MEFEIPATRYTKTADGLYLAYSVSDLSPPSELEPLDVVFVPAGYSHIELFWEDETSSQWIRRVAGYSRIILFNKRGSGLSDPVRGRSVPTPDEWMDDLEAVLDAVGSTRTALIAVDEGGPVALLFAATRPQRTSSVVLINSFARLSRAEDYPWGIPPGPQEAMLRTIGESWGTGLFADTMFGEEASPATRRSLARHQRFAVSPGVAVESFRAVFQIDVRHVLPTIRVPTLVIHTKGDRYVRPEHGRYLAENIPNARYVELEGDHALWAGPDAAIAEDEIEEFLTGTRGTLIADRVLATVLFTDIVGSTAHAARVGDARWRETLDSHHRIVRRQLERFRGREVDTAGDGFLAVFDGPGRAIGCATEIRAQLKTLGLQIRAGIHTGEVEQRGTDLAGIAVHIGARVAALAQPDEILVSVAVPPLVAGSGIQFTDRGEHELKGVPNPWRLYAAET